MWGTPTIQLGTIQSKKRLVVYIDEMKPQRVVLKYQLYIFFKLFYIYIKFDHRNPKLHPRVNFLKQ